MRNENPRRANGAGVERSFEGRRGTARWSLCAAAAAERAATTAGLPTPDQAATAAPLFLRFTLAVVVCAPAASRRRSSLSLFRSGRRVPRVLSASGRAGRDPFPRETESDGSSTPAGLRNLSRLLGVERLLAGLWGDGAEGSGGGGALLDGGGQSPLLLSSSSVSRFLILIPLPATTSSRMISRALLVLRGLARPISLVEEDLGPKLDIDVRRFEAL